MGALGTLAAKIILDVNEWTINHEKARNVAAETATTVDKHLKDLERSANTSLAGVAASLTAAIAAGYGFNKLIEQFDKFVESAARLKQLSQITGSTVESLSQISGAAKMVGSSIDNAAPAIDKMIKGLTGVDQETTAAGAGLKFLELSSTNANGSLKSGGELYIEIAKKFAGLEDGAGKVALAMAFFGKAGAEQIPILNKLGEAGGSLVKITTAQAEQAEQYKQSLIALQAAQGTLFRTISAEVLPVATAFVTSLVKMQFQTQGLAGAAKDLASDGSIKAFAIESVSALTTVITGIELVYRMTQVLGVNIAKLVGDISHNTGDVLLALGGAASGNFAMANAALSEVYKRLDRSSRDYEDALGGILDKQTLGQRIAAQFAIELENVGKKGEEAPKKSADAFAALLARLKALAAAGGGGVVDYTAAIQKLNDEQLKLAGANGGYSQLIAANEKYQADLRAGKQINIDQVQAYMLAAVATDQLAISTKSATDAQKQADEEYRKTIDAYNALTDAAEKRIEKLHAESDLLAFDTSLIGLSNNARAITLLQYQRQVDLSKAIDDADKKRINNAYDSIIANTKINQSITEQVSLWGTVSDRAGAFFSDLAVNGKSAFDKLRNELKNFVQEIIALFAKKWVLSMVAGVTGSSVIGNAAASAGQGTLAGAAGNFIGGAGTAIGGAYGASEGFAMGWASGVAGPTAGFAETAGAGLAAIGPVGWVAIAAIVLAAYFSSQGGGPKTGGYSGSSFDASGNLVGSMAAPGTDNGRYFTPSQMDSQLKQITDGYGKAVGDALKRYGITGTQAFSFLLGTDSDPKGSAQSRVSAGVLDASGNALYQNRDQNVSDSKNIPAVIALEFSRGVLVALQNSHLPDYLKKAFEGLDAMARALWNSKETPFIVQSILERIEHGAELQRKGVKS